MARETGAEPGADDFIREAGRRWTRSDSAAPPPWNIEPDLEVYEEDEDTGGGMGTYRFARNDEAMLEREVKTGYLRATVRAERPPEGAGRLIADLRTWLLGAPLASSRAAHERLSKVKALAILSSDALSSVAYATEQTNAVLLLAGAAAFGLSMTIGGAILLLLVLVGLSYRQTIKAYPNGGGSYIVASDNLGTLPGLVAAAALMTDYVLTVSVSVSAGVSAVTSAFPSLSGATVEIGLVVIALMVLVNLRGVREAGNVFTVPTYLFIIAMGLLVVAGTARLVSGGPHTPLSGHTNYPGNLSGPVETLGLLLVLKAFSSGCTALTGVEAISNGVPVFKKPEWRNARTTLTAMVVILGLSFAGVTFLAHQFNLWADYTCGPGEPGILGQASCAAQLGPYQTVLSKLGHVAFGNGIGYFYLQATTALILVLAANTSFADFPRLLFLLARDKFAPNQFVNIGDRLAFSNGILFLGILAALLYWYFRGSTDALIPLYTIGVFTAFTLSQFGMVVHWRRMAMRGGRDAKGWRTSMAFNFAGGVGTSIVLVIAAVSKFVYGAWVVVVLVPVLVAVMLAIHRHYTTARSRLQAETPLTPGEVHPVAVVPINDLTDVTLGTLALARRIADQVIAVYISDDDARVAAMKAKWDAWGNHVQLQVILSPYRSVIRPLLNFLDALEDQLMGHTLMVVLPEMVHTRWWHQFLHNQTALRLKASLLFRPGTVVVNVPYHIREDRDHDHDRDDGWQLPPDLARESGKMVPDAPGPGGPV